jgi:CRP-like cAMP-binding protein
MTEIPSKPELLARAELFSGVAENTLEEIAGIAELRSYDEGDIVYQMGDPADHAFVQVSGRVRFTLGVGNRPGGSGSIMTSRMTFGWAALVDEHPRRVATASCLEPSVLLVIDGRRLLSILEKDTASGFLVMRRLSSMIARNFLE